MRISDEIDALEVMGISSKAYILASRLLGAWIATPFLILVGNYLWSVSNKWVPVKMLGFLSPGMFDHGFWDFQAPMELFFLIVKGMLTVTVIVLVACYYGFHARGGPVGVGWNTAKSMMVNVVLIHVLDDLGQELLFGTGGKFPIGN
jgi:phospholipid/cholesterol/gamma-HCH transport system permease protein